MLSVFGILIIVVMWRWSINHLYTLPQYAIAAFTSLTTSAFYTISVVVVFLVTGLTFFSWSQSSNIQTTVQSLVDHLKGKRDEDGKPDKPDEDPDPDDDHQHHHPDL